MDSIHFTRFARKTLTMTGVIPDEARYSAKGYEGWMAKLVAFCVDGSG
jgi:hypothetical protein